MELLFKFLLTLLKPYLLLHFVLIDDLLVLGGIVAIPLIALRLPPQLNLHQDFISTDIFTSVLGTDFARAFNARFGAVGQCTAVSACPFPELCCGPSLRRVLHEASLVVLIDRLFLTGGLLSLVVQHLGVVDRVSCLLIHIPGRVLDELRHVLQVDLFDGASLGPTHY